MMTIIVTWGFAPSAILSVAYSGYYLAVGRPIERRRSRVCGTNGNGRRRRWQCIHAVVEEEYVRRGIANRRRGRTENQHWHHPGFRDAGIEGTRVSCRGRP